MTSVNLTAAKPTSTPTGANAARPVSSAPNQEAGAGRGIGQTLANVGGKAAEIGKDVAQKSVSAIADQAIAGVEHSARHAVRASVLNPMAMLYSYMNIFLPFGVGKNLFSAVVSKFFLPYYQQINPHTKITSEQIISALEHGHTDSLEDELFHAFDKFINSNLKDDERAKYEAGDKMVVVKAFKNLAMSQITTAREPGGLKKIGNAIANWIPFIKKLPEGAKPWVGGAIGAFVLMKVVKLGWKMLKWGIAMFAGITGLKFIANKFGGGTPPPPGMGSMPSMGSDDSSPEAGGGMMSKLLSGAGQLAKIATQAQGGGHGAPGGGLGSALSMLGGGGGH